MATRFPFRSTPRTTRRRRVTARPQDRGGTPPLVPWARYRGVDADTTERVVPDSSGNGRDSITIEYVGSLDPILSSRALRLSPVEYAAGQEHHLDFSHFAPVPADGTPVTIVLTLRCREDGTFIACNSSDGSGNKMLYLPRSGATVVNIPTEETIDNNENQLTIQTIVIQLEEGVSRFDVYRRSEFEADGFKLIYSSSCSSNFLADDVWSVGQEYDGGLAKGNFARLDFHELELFDRLLAPDELAEVFARHQREYVDFCSAPRFPGHPSIDIDPRWIRKSQTDVLAAVSSFKDAHRALAITQGSGSLQPLLTNDGALEFDGADDLMQAIIDALDLTNGYTIFVAEMTYVTDLFSGWVTIDSGSDTDDDDVVEMYSVNVSSNGFGVAVVKRNPEVVVTQNDSNLWSTLRANSVIMNTGRGLFKGDTQQAPVTAGQRPTVASDTLKIGIGYEGDGNETTEGRIMRIVIYEGELTASQQEAVRAHLERFHTIDVQS